MLHDFAARSTGYYAGTLPPMIRGVGLRGAVSLNVITMIGIGPLITIPLVLSQLAGPLALAGWVCGAIVALCDGLVWAELGSRYPGSGGTYVYLREIFGARRLGRMLAFLFNWQFFLSASLIISTGFIGFANYAGYLFPVLTQSAAANHMTAVGVGIVTIALLYRRITALASFGNVLAVLAVGTLIIVGIAGYAHADWHRAFTISTPTSFGIGFIGGLGGALYITMYDYLGYSQIALVGEEVADPQRTVPRAIIISILIVLALYVFLQVGVLGAIPWQRLVGTHGGPPPAQAQYVGSIVVAQAWGPWAGKAVTVLVLITAFASVYGGLLGASRVPFAAARDAAFLPPFARLHPTKAFPYVSLVAMGAIALVACFFDLNFVIAVIGTSSILAGSIAQIMALGIFRARGAVAPFRMAFYPLPALIALAGWALAFANTGVVAIALGVGWLAVGFVVYLVMARAQRFWPFALALAAFMAMSIVPRPAAALTQPQFVYGATFFYERIPRAQWPAALAAYRRMGINTIDLYVMWNWHELSDGVFDFSGRTNRRRDLRSLLQLIHRNGFALILRPGPVIRNEWRNGGYPAWLLVRPQYHMPLSDILEGRYPATATLQNSHSDDAAAQWLANPVHMHYATRWLRAVLSLASPYRSSIIGVALDDDQGAYLDNQTWPAPHFRRYVSYLANVVHATLGESVPVFINTYQMKVTASSPVWAWGNWYQSDAYSIGEHDRAQLEFTAALLATQARDTVMMSEFQAGWLQGADEAAPRPADPTNTTLALHTLLQTGAHGIVNFPVQDTLNPPGWEAPWTNEFYSWDAALSVQLTPQARYAPTARFGSLIAHFGPSLAQTRPVTDALIAYTASAYDASRLGTDDVASIANATIAAQRGCRIVRITCGLVDLRYATRAQLLATRLLIVPRSGINLPYAASVVARLRTYRHAGGRIITSLRFARVAHPAAGGIPNAVLLADTRGNAFIDVVNYARRPLDTRAATVEWGRFSAVVPALRVPPRDAVLVRLGTPPMRVADYSAPPDVRVPRDVLPLRRGSWVTSEVASGSGVLVRDVLDDGYSAVLFSSRDVRLIVEPCAGARALVFEDRHDRENVFTTVGGLRDAWSPERPPTSRDYIARYTHPLPTGTFNRCYARAVQGTAATFSYNAPDAPSNGMRFTKRITLAPDGFSVDALAEPASSERAAQITSFHRDSSTVILTQPRAYGLYDATRKRLAIVCWRNFTVRARLTPAPHSALLTLMYPSGTWLHVVYVLRRVASITAAQAVLLAFSNAR